MKKMRYAWVMLPAFLYIAAITFLSNAQGLLPYVSRAVTGEIFPANYCGQDKKMLLISELFPIKLDLLAGDETYGYSYLYADGIMYGDYYKAQEKADNYALSSLDKSTEDSETSDYVAEGSTETADGSSSDNAALSETDAVAVINTDGIVSGPTPINYSMSQLLDFETLISECYVVDSSTTVTEDELDVENLLGMDMGIDTGGDEIKVLIYHTHGSETFSDSRDGVIEDTVIGVGDVLAELLENTYGIKVYHDRNIYDNINGVIDRSNAYNLAGAAIDEILAENPGIEVVLDLHRDGVNDEVRLVRTVDGKETAQIMFLNGVSRLKSSGDIEYLYNPHKTENLSFSLKLFLNGRSLYGDLIRKIYIRGYCFNLDRVARSSLIEVGAQTNTVEEAKNAMIPLARILNQVLSE
jgi:stage II sporulation protein P